MTEGGALLAHLVGFVRLLRRAGLPVGPAETLAAAAALAEVGLAERDIVHAALRATLVHRREHFDLFDYAFDLWWRHPKAAALPAGPPEAGKPPPAVRRVQEALAAERPGSSPHTEDVPPRGACRARRVRVGAAATHGFRGDGRGRDRRGEAADHPPRAAAGRSPDAPFPSRSRVGRAWICGGRCAPPCAVAAASWPWPAFAVAAARRRWWRCATSPAAWRVTPRSCCTSCTRWRTGESACRCSCSAHG